MWSAAILAGGRARRLGGLDKSALIVDGVAVIDRQLAVLRGRARNIVLVGFRGPGPAPCPVVDDLTPGAGPLGALVTALMSATTDRVFVLAGDMPFITAPFVEYLATLAHVGARGRPGQAPAGGIRCAPCMHATPPPSSQPRSTPASEPSRPR